MKTRIFLTFISLFCLSLGLFNELEFSNTHDQAQQITKASNDLADCKSDDCHDEGGHCEHHCSGLHNIFFTDYSISTKPEAVIINNSHIPKLDFYKNPYLSRNLRPPLA
ncbi:hypothetical protein [Bacteriovorax sp. Seq25_V]|uniref:hypothetical protein n=1 Tax=Bacteriovorax sp. Seq25_V TaxID=1201288 RepID=UPI00038A2C50|nr:hypothetical protein [Bacteriovorax sp. Seq25_V]EQC46126.1 hypothetical protein M900_1832 [Bacteriovorax sp. Seq25_V]